MYGRSVCEKRVEHLARTMNGKMKQRTQPAVASCESAEGRTKRMVTRRSFLGAAAMAAGSSTSAQTRPVRLGFIGVGSRGTGLVRGLLAHDGVEGRAICDINEQSLERARDLVERAGRKRPEGYSRGVEDY